MKYSPPFALTDKIVNNYGLITEIIGQFKAKNILDVNPTLRRENQIKSITSTCAIEGNTLSESVVSDILDHKRVIGPTREILEIKNALELYKIKDSLDYKKIQDLLKAHKILMRGLINDVGCFRKGGIGVLQGKKVIYMAPPGSRVQHLMNDLFEWVQKNSHNIVIQSAIFHCEFETIHPFSDGNGRMGRFWQNLMLIEYHPIFRSVPVESIVHHRQQQYYHALMTSQKSGDCTPFVEFSLLTIVEALKKVFNEVDVKDSSTHRLTTFVQTYRGKIFMRADYMKFFKGIAPATASNDLREGVRKKLFQRSGDKRTTTYKIVAKNFE